MKRNHIKKVVEMVGGQSLLAEELGPPVKQQHVWNWLNRDQQIPAKYAIPIERITGGKITRHDLRPDIYPIEDI